jgi:hypothetical protein
MEMEMGSERVWAKNLKEAGKKVHRKLKSFSWG